MNSLDFRLVFEYGRSALAGRCGLSIDLLAASTVEVIDKPLTISGDPCVVLPNQFERVRACAFGSDPAKEIAELMGAPRSIPATKQYTLNNVIIWDGFVLGYGKRKVFNPNIEFDSSNDWQEHDEVALRSSLVGCHFFGHWLRDDCATHLLAEKLAPVASMPTPAWPDRQGYAAQLGQTYDDIRRARVNRLFLFDDIHQNRGKAERFLKLRELMKVQNAPAGEKIVYLMRGGQGKQRSVSNEGELVNALTKESITAIRAETLSVAELIHQLAGARIIISVEGSQLSHALFNLQDRGAVLVLQPPDRFFNSHFDWARALGMHYGLVVGIDDENGFRVPVGDVLRTLDLLKRKL